MTDLNPDADDSAEIQMTTIFPLFQRNVLTEKGKSVATFYG